MASPKKNIKKTKAKPQSKAKIGTRRSTMKKHRAPKRTQVLKVWGKRLATICIILLVISWGALWVFLSNSDEKASNWIKSSIVSSLANAGFRVENILVEGRKHSDPDILLALINMGKDDPIFLFNPIEAKTQIEKIGWVKSVRVERRLPDTIYIKLNERTPLALWKNNKTLSLIGENGEVITKSNLSEFKDLLMVQGRGAPLKAGKLISIIDAEPELKALVDNAELVDNRRWNLYLDDGKLIKLPEAGIGLAMRNLVMRNKQSKILVSKAISVIDARYQGRLIVRTKLGKVQDYKAGIVDASESL